MLLPFSRQDELTGFKSWLHRHPPPPPPPPTPPPTLPSALCPPTLRPHHPPSLPPPLTAFTPLPLSPPGRPWFGSGLCHCPHLAALGSGFQVFRKYLEASNVCPNPLRPPTALSASSTATALSASPSHSTSSPPSPSLPPPLTAFTPLPLSPPARPWFGFPSLEEVFKASNVCPNPLRPHRPHRPHRPQRFVHPHRHQRFALHSTSSPPSPSLPPPLTAFVLCHCPHLVALGSAFQVFKKYLEASNVCPNPLRPHRPTAPSASSTPTAFSASPSLPPPLTAFTPRPLSPPGRPWFRSLPLSPPGRPWFGFRRSKFQQKEQTARKKLENFSSRSKPLETNYRISAEGANRSKGTREFQNNEQTARKELDNSAEGANRSKGTREIQQMEQTARNEKENFSRRSKPLKRGWRILAEGANRSKETEEFQQK